jgi:predicted SpoU family rRNA methylase
MNKVKAPALFIYSENDQVVDVDKIKNVIENWGGITTVEKRVMTSSDDPQSHVIAGDIRSPSQTRETSDLIIEWAMGL